MKDKRAIAAIQFNRVRLWVLLAITLLPSGCMVGTTRILTNGERSRIERLAIVPMESPPLEVRPGVALPLGSSLVVAPEPIGAGGRVLASVFGILILADLPRAVEAASRNAETLERMLQSDVGWSPTVVLANYLARRLRQGGKHEVALDDRPRAFPGLERRERTTWLLNWMVPIRDWYKADTSPIEYSEFAARNIDAVLEVAVWGYSIGPEGSVASDILIELSDPKTGALLARTWRYNGACGKVPHPFDNDAEGLRAAIAGCLERLGDSALEEIGLR